MGLTGLTFLGHVIIGELLVGERPTLGHHGGVDILAIGGADGHGAAIAVNVPRFAAHVLPGHELNEFAPGRDHRRPDKLEEEMRREKPFTLWFEEISSGHSSRDLKRRIGTLLAKDVRPNKHHADVMALGIRNILTCPFHLIDLDRNVVTA